MANNTVLYSFLNKQKLNKPKQYLCTHITRASESLHSARGELDRAIDSLEKLDAHVRLFFRTFNIKRGEP